MSDFEPLPDLDKYEAIFDRLTAEAEPFPGLPPTKFVLDADGNPQPERNVLRWARWFDTADEQRLVAKTFLGSVCVQTDFLGMNLGYAYPVPLLYETMVFGGVCDQFQRRYATREEAIAGHEETIAAVKQAEDAELEELRAGTIWP